MGDFKWNMEAFSDAYRRYTEVSKRAPAEICNNKAYFIARKASWFTAKTSRAAIADSLGSRTSGRRRLTLRPGDSQDAPLAALIIQAARARKGLPGLYGAEMEAAINELIARRLKSISFLRSGWLPAIRILGRFVRRPGTAPPIGELQQFGPDAGSANPASEEWNAIATIINYAVSQSRTSQQSNYAGFKREGDLGLSKAFEDETASMEQYIEDHLRPDAEEFNRRAA